MNRAVLYRNLPNLVSLLGVTPLCLLNTPLAFQLLPALIIFNNLMDDLDGILARKLNPGSRFGAALDNVCDAAAHAGITLYVGSLYGGVSLLACQLAAAAVLLRLTGRLMPEAVLNRGSTTNELMRHLLFVVLLERDYGVSAAPWIVSVLLLHSVSLLVRFPMPHLLRTQAKRPATVLGLNGVLLVAWLVPAGLIPIALAFVSTYLYSFGIGAWRCWRSQPHVA